jgi:hypothetical protein
MNDETINVSGIEYTIIDSVKDDNSIEGYYRRQEEDEEGYSVTTDGWNADVSVLLQDESGGLYIAAGNYATEIGANPIYEGYSDMVILNIPEDEVMKEWIDMDGTDIFSHKYAVQREDYKSNSVLTKSNRTSKGHGYTDILTTSVCK